MILVKILFFGSVSNHKILYSIFSIVGNPISNLTNRIDSVV
ncbi:hypothetical protein LEP1GSC038_2267 [Leptospira weilii str. 2006001855]|uniref:Uncharacterized protein n=1 Tax=Leptospira weilii str. 2006001855 TaxID=996804 RepID=M6G4M1_9LEPT|nr:hypothetical protein LEP1GSC051_2048 [Leptospira sp. P2653]EMM73896.1 hypothetical protein LEP1GSC038_2267 [Leptospira weilii str. 2006001855]